LPSVIIAAAALQGTAAATSSTATLIKGTLKIMAWTKLKTTAVVGVGLLLAAGATTVAVKEMAYRRASSWQDAKYFDDRIMDGTPPQVQILPSKHPNGGGWGENNGKLMGFNADARQLLNEVYGWSPVRTVFAARLPTGRYDYIANLERGSREALKNEAIKKFGVSGHHETISTNVLLLIVRRPNAPGLKPSQTRNVSNQSGSGVYRCSNKSIDGVARLLEGRMKIPVMDGTGLTGSYDIELKWAESDWQHPNNEALKQTVLDQLGLELVPDVQPVDFLVIDKAR
jgi:uncharacterized protein (TIGR03435 family)